MAQIEAEVLCFEDPKADYEKLKLELESKVKSDQGNGAEMEQVKLTYLINLTKNNLRLTETMTWLGFSPALPGNMPPGSYSALNHKRVIWGFVYTNGAPDNTSTRMWVVAFDTGARKAYAETGPISPVDWTAIGTKLDQSGCKTEFAEICGSIAKVTYYD